MEGSSPRLHPHIKLEERTITRDRSHNTRLSTHLMLEEGHVHSRRIQTRLHLDHLHSLNPRMCPRFIAGPQHCHNTSFTHSQVEDVDSPE